MSLEDFQRRQTRCAMAEGLSNTTSNDSFVDFETNTLFNESRLILLLAVVSTVCLAIILVNTITVIVFVKQRQLQRRSTYLIIHLAIVDLLVGAISGPSIILQLIGCYLWRYHTVLFHFGQILPMTSIITLAVISLERVHATFRPFRHRFVKKRVYGVTIAAIWLITTCREAVAVVLLYLIGDHNLALFVDLITKLSYWLFSIFLICVSYVSICIKMRYNLKIERRGATNRERKLTATLIWVTLVSLVTWLPYTIFLIFTAFSNELPDQLNIYLKLILLMLIGANSLANPIVYAVRMPVFRAGVARICRKTPNDTHPVDLPPGII